MPTTTATDSSNLLDTLIVGAGISGLSLAYALQQDRWLRKLRRLTGALGFVAPAMRGQLSEQWGFACLLW